MSCSPKRQSILLAAARMFLEHGFAATSMDAIAEAAPVSKPTLYKHFADKKALFAAVIQDRAHARFARLSALLEGEEEPEGGLMAVAHEFLEVIYDRDTIRLYQLVIGESRQFADLGETVFSCGPQQLLDVITAWMLRQTSLGKMQVKDPRDAASRFIGMLKGVEHTRVLFGIGDVPSPARKRAIARSAVACFMARYCPCSQNR